MTLSLLIVLIHTTIHASQASSNLYTWNEKIKNNLLEHLNQYKQLVCTEPNPPQGDQSAPDYAHQIELFEQNRAELKASLHNNCVLKSYIALHDDIEKLHEPTKRLMYGAQSLLWKALAHNEIKEEWMHAQKEALKIESPTVQEIENAYDNFRKKLTQQLAAITLAKTGIICHPVTDMASRINFLQPLANVSPEKCDMLNQAIIAEYQIAPIIEQRAVFIMQSKTQNN